MLDDLQEKIQTLFDVLGMPPENSKETHPFLRKLRLERPDDIEANSRKAAMAQEFTDALVAAKNDPKAWPPADLPQISVQALKKIMDNGALPVADRVEFGSLISEAMSHAFLQFGNSPSGDIFMDTSSRVTSKARELSFQLTSPPQEAAKQTLKQPSLFPAPKTDASPSASEQLNNALFTARAWAKDAEVAAKKAIDSLGAWADYLKEKADILLAPRPMPPPVPGRVEPRSDMMENPQKHQPVAANIVTSRVEVNSIVLPVVAPSTTPAKPPAPAQLGDYPGSVHQGIAQLKARLGDAGLRNLQEELAAYGAKVQINGDLDKRTIEALQHYANKRTGSHLKTDGTLGEKTWDALLQLSQKKGTLLNTVLNRGFAPEIP